jgi:hypothetical protein
MGWNDHMDDDNELGGRIGGLAGLAQIVVHRSVEDDAGVVREHDVDVSTIGRWDTLANSAPHRRDRRESLPIEQFMGMGMLGPDLPSTGTGRGRRRWEWSRRRRNHCPVG